MINLLIFSPTGNSMDVAQTFAKEIGSDVRIVDLTKMHQLSVDLNTEDLVVIAGPVFGGRMPSLMLERLKSYSLNGSRVVTLVTYGNRAYEDALLELNDTVVAMGGLPIASGALVAKHSMVPSIAKERPNEVDLHNLKVFARLVHKKLKNDHLDRVQVPGHFPYRSWSKPPFTPFINELCVKCGDCVRHCPAGAISAVDPANIDPQKCIFCMRCVSRCPQHARSMPEAVKMMIAKKLEPIANIYRENEYFL